MLIAALVQTVATVLLAGIAWTVQMVVYPAFALVPAGSWARYHAAHSRAITLVVGPPWVAQGLATAALLILAPGEPLVWVAAVAAAAGVAVTLPAVSLHGRLDPAAHPGDLRRLLRVNLVRALVWSAGSVAGVLLTTASGA
ncbi:hypothetical protein ND486_03410 [Pseudonocardia sp. DR1-2]|uniref:hypothetical protein n=1 Tax=Pseudonocardia sp. DR1-2 TaxID=2951168 RepID=UPI002044301D|nr:hypothetical protein [Pseudonocardia sp. DR1-2]MCM3845240.1 hypothetical protein [Pseudonocardia sp. DR1-2]